MATARSSAANWIRKPLPVRGGGKPAGRGLPRKRRPGPGHVRKLALEARHKQGQRARRQGRQQRQQTAVEFALGVQKPEADEPTAR